MKILTFILMAFILAACGAGDKSSSKSSTISDSYLSPTTVDGYIFNNGMLQINGTNYQMVSSLQGSQLNQQLQSSGIQPTMISGNYAYRAHITGGLYNQCQQYLATNANACSGTSQTNTFYVSAVQFF